MFVSLIPNALVRLFARPYVAGDHIGAALDVGAHLLERAGIHATLDLLAEEMETQERIEANRGDYRDLIDGIADDPRFSNDATRPTVSVKLSSFTLAPLEKGGDAAGSADAMRVVAEHARQRGIGLTVDMEDRHWTDFTLDQALGLFAEGFDVGAVLQSRLLRTDADVERIPAGMRVRTVIGIYPEPADVALTAKPAMKERLVAQSLRLLERGAFVELASHDEQVIRTFVQQALAAGHTGSKYEIQMLYGVPRAGILDQLQSGAIDAGGTPPIVRLYVPFATDWDQATAYCRRRMAGNPDLVMYVIRNLLSSLRGQSSGVSQYAR